MPVFNVIGGVVDATEQGNNTNDVDLRAITFIYGWALSTDPVGNPTLYEHNEGTGNAHICQATGIMSNHLVQRGWPDSKNTIRGVSYGPVRPPR